MPSNYSVTCTVEYGVNVDINKLVSSKYLAGSSFGNHVSYKELMFHLERKEISTRRKEHCRRHNEHGACA
jgi:hypothetical protein